MESASRVRPRQPWLEVLAQDLRYGLRTLRRSPGFTAAALITLALGIGANTAIFSVVNAVLLRPLPYREPGALVQLVRAYQTGLAAGQDGRRYLFFRDHLRSVDALAAYRGAGSVNMVRGDRAEFVSIAQVSREYFPVFGVQPVLGQPFGAEHDVAGGPAVAILGHRLWQRSFGANAGVVGSTIVIADKPLTVIGVMPESFEPIVPADVFVPLRAGLTGPGGGFNYAVAGRLRPGTSLAQANADVAAAWHAFGAEFPEIKRPDELPARVISLQESIARPVKPALLMIAAAVGLLLLIACANMANLLLARASSRGREVALRAALGAGRGRIVRQMLTESVLLSLSGAAAGLVIAYWSVPALLALTPPAYLPATGVRIDAPVLGATAVVAVVTGLLFGLAPALSLARQDLVEAFKDDGARSSGSRRSGWLRRVLVTAEVALCMLLLVGAGLLVQTFVRLRAVDPGFDPRGVLTARMSLQGERYAMPEALTRFYDEGLARIRSIPGVRAAAVVNGVPLERALNLNVDVLDGPEKIEDALTDWRYATPGYFAAMGIPIVAGRAVLRSRSRRRYSSRRRERGVRPAILQGHTGDRPPHPRLRRRRRHRDRRHRARSQRGRAAVPAAAGDVRAGRADARKGAVHDAQLLPRQLGGARRPAGRRADSRDRGTDPRRRSPSAVLHVQDDGRVPAEGDCGRTVSDDDSWGVRRYRPAAGCSRRLRPDRILGRTAHA